MKCKIGGDFSRICWEDWMAWKVDLFNLQRWCSIEICTLESV